MDRYCLKNSKIHEVFEEEPVGFEPEAIFHLSADGGIQKVGQIPVLYGGEGLLMYVGEFYVEPLEIQIEFVKAADAEQWLRALILRHTERVRQVAEDLCILAEIKEVDV
mgnify:FL=1